MKNKHAFCFSSKTHIRWRFQSLSLSSRARARWELSDGGIFVKFRQTWVNFMPQRVTPKWPQNWNVPPKYVCMFWSSRLPEPCLFSCCFYCYYCWFVFTYAFTFFRPCRSLKPFSWQCLYCSVLFPHAETEGRRITLQIVPKGYLKRP